MRIVLTSLLIVLAPVAHAQDAIFKCVDPKGATTYQNAPCPDDSKVEAIREYQPISRQEAIAAEQERQQRIARQQQQFRQDQARVANRVQASQPTTVQRTRAGCTAAKRDRDRARRNAPLWRHVHYLEPWEKRVREACKGMW